MNVTGPFSTDARGGFKALAALARGIEKASKTGHSGAQTQDRRDKQHNTPPHLTVELVCQDETRGFDPYWDGPRLVPSFVAQVLGQALAERRESRVAVETAYGRCLPRQALLFDRKS